MAGNQPWRRALLWQTWPRLRNMLSRACTSYYAQGTRCPSFHAQRRLKRWQRAQARRTKGSRGWWEAQRRIDSAHRRATGLRNNAHHQVSRALVGKYHTLGIETLNVAGMIKAGLQPKALADAGMARLLTQIRYKAQWYSTQVVAASRRYPSSKTCSACGEVNKDLGRKPIWTCPSCGVTHVAATKMQLATCLNLHGSR